jgi:hypothetical protein
MRHAAAAAIAMLLCSTARAEDTPDDVPDAYGIALDCARTADYACVIRVLHHPRTAREFELLLGAMRAVHDTRYEAVLRTYCSRFRCPEYESSGW